MLLAQYVGTPKNALLRMKGFETLPLMITMICFDLMYICMNLSIFDVALLANISKEKSADRATSAIVDKTSKLSPKTTYSSSFLYSIYLKSFVGFHWRDNSTR